MNDKPASVAIDDLLSKRDQDLACSGWGRTGSGIGAPGHVDLDEELPWPEFEPWHAWYRPMTWEWYEKSAGDTASRSTYAAMLAEGAVEACDADDEGAEPWTMIATGA